VPAAAASAPNASSSPGAAVALVASSGLRPFSDVIKGAKAHPGFITLYRQEEKVWMEILPEHMNTPFHFMFNTTHSAGERGLYAGQTLRSFHAVFKRIGNQMQLILKNTEHTATPGTPQAIAVAQSFSDSLMSSVPVLSQPHVQSKGILIDASSLLFADLPSYSTQLEAAYRMGHGFDRSNTSFTAVYADPKQANLLVNAHYYTPRVAAPSMSPSPVPQVPLPSTLQDTRSLFVGFVYSFAALPAVPIRPRMADDRMGHFVMTLRDYSDDTQRTTARYMVTRWRLEKADPAAALSEPKEPIVYWLDKNVPEKYRQSIIEGVLEWNKAFERIGFKNALVVKQQTATDTFDTMDSRHASIRWYFGVDAPAAFGPSVKDERSGEILDADIQLIDGHFRGARRFVADRVGPSLASAAHALHEGCDFAHAAVNSDGFAQQLLLARGELEPDSPLAEQLAQATAKRVVMHEVGHTLGLRHNFRASSIYSLKQLQDAAFTKVNGMAGSIMDYLPLTVFPKGQPQGEYMASTLGPYDYWAIEYAYKPIDADKEADELARIAARSTEPALAYGSDEDAHSTQLPDPSVSGFDLGDDPLAYAQQRIEMVRELWDRLQVRQLKPGESYGTLRRSFDLGFSEFGAVLPFVTKHVGGTTVLRDRAGTGRAVLTPIAVARQQAALKLLTDNLFTAKSLDFPPEFLSRLGSGRLNAGTLPDVSISSRTLSLQTRVLDQLMSEQTALRLLSSAEKVRDPKKTLSLRELYATVQSSIWSELAQGKGITLARRNLQRAHLKLIANAVMRPPALGASADGRSLQRAQAVVLVSSIQKALGKPASAEAKAHLFESMATLQEVLKASLVRPGV